MKSYKSTIYYDAESNSKVGVFTMSLSEFLNESACVDLVATVNKDIPEAPPNSEQGEAVQTSTQHAKVNMTRLKELRDQSVSLMDQKEPIGSAYVYEIVNEFIKSAGE